jgi:multidrug efflux pump
MTSVATIAGHFPLVLARGPGAGSRNSIGTVLVTGMGVGTLFTLFVVPAIYMLVARNRAASATKAETEEVIVESELEHVAGVASLRGDVLGKQR